MVGLIRDFGVFNSPFNYFPGIPPNKCIASGI